MMLKKVISGGQTGVDRAGLDAAMNAGVPVGGCCPKGRKAENGTIPDTYQLQELESAEYDIRTEKNVIQSDGTLILNKDHLSEETKATFDYTVKHLKPCLIIQLDAEQMIEPVQVIRWMQGQEIIHSQCCWSTRIKISRGHLQGSLLVLRKCIRLAKGVSIA